MTFLTYRVKVTKFSAIHAHFGMFFFNNIKINNPLQADYQISVPSWMPSSKSVAIVIAEPFVQLFWALAFISGVIFVHTGMNRPYQCSQVIRVTYHWNEIGDKVDGQDEITQHHKSWPCRMWRPLGSSEYIIEQQSRINDFDTRLLGYRGDLVPKLLSEYPTDILFMSFSII